MRSNRENAVSFSYPYSDFIADYPEFEDIPQPVAGREVTRAVHDSRGVAGEECRRLLAGLLAAHRLAARFDIGAKVREKGLRNPYELASAGKSMSAGTGSLSLSATAAALQTGTDPYLVDLGRTVYGLDYLTALERCVPGVSVILSPDTSSSLGM